MPGGTPHQDFTAIHPVAAEMRERGFRLLALREVHSATEPPAFAVIDQYILRRPERLSRHAVFFAATFRADIMAWLGAQIGRPAQHDAEGRAHRNPRWPAMAWQREPRSWPDGTSTTEWLVEVSFQDDASWAMFRDRWNARLQGKSEETAGSAR